MTRPVRNKLFDLEFDEVSAVDRPANQHGLIAFAKSAGLGEPSNSQEEPMPEIQVYDSDGIAVDGDSLEHGDVVYGEDGTEYVWVDADAEEDGDESGSDEDGEGDEQAYYAEDAEDEDAYAGVGKGLPGLGRAAFMTGAKQTGRDAARGARQQTYGFMHGLSRNRTGASPGAPGVRASRAGSAVWGNRSNLQRAGIAGTPLVAGTAGTAEAGRRKFNTNKSLGDEVLEGLSKAVNDDERNQYIAKALDEIEVYKAANEAMATELDAMREEQITEVFIAKAAEYNLPVSPGVLGPILKAMTEVLSDEQLEVVDQLFASVGDALYDEIGYVGDTDNVSVLDQVNAYAGEMVAKSNGLTPEQAQVLAFESNPAAYEAYLNEIGR